MKKTIITLLMACFAITFSFGQSKGDNFVGLNFGTSKNTYEIIQTTKSSSTNINFGLNYSHFIKENRRLNFGISYFNSKNDGQSNSLPYETKTRGYGASVGYGILFPLLKNFYAEVTPSVNYSYGRNLPQSTNANASIINNSYATNLTGGVLWLPFKHFGLSANLAALSLGYSNYKTTETSNNQTTKNSQSSFSFNNQGSLQNQTFSIFYKF